VKFLFTNKPTIASKLFCPRVLQDSYALEVRILAFQRTGAVQLTRIFKPLRYVKLQTDRKHKLSKRNWTVEFEGVHLTRVYRVWAFKPDHRFAMMNLAISFEICELAFLRDTIDAVDYPLITPLYTLGGVRIHPTKPSQASKLVSKPRIRSHGSDLPHKVPKTPSRHHSDDSPLKQRQGTPEVPRIPSDKPDKLPLAPVRPLYP